MRRKFWWLAFSFFYFYAPVSKDWGAYCFTDARLSVCLSVCLRKLNVKTLHFPITPKLIYLQGSYLVWRHISSICICWYQGQGHLQRSRSNIKITFLKRWPFLGHSCFTNTSCFSITFTTFWAYFRFHLQMLSIFTSVKFYCCNVMISSFVINPLRGSLIRVSDSWPGGCEFDPQLRQTFIPAYFHLSPLWEKWSVALDRKVVLVLVWEIQETCVCHWLPW